jgi:hypothetical protein
MERKLSKVSIEQMKTADETVKQLFDEYSTDSRMSSAQFCSLAMDCKLEVETSQLTLIFAGVKLGKKQDITFDRFVEAFRKVGMLKGTPYQVLSLKAAENRAETKGGTAATTAAAPPAAVVAPVSSPRAVGNANKLLFRNAFSKDSQKKEDTFFNLTPNLSTWAHSNVLSASNKFWAVPWKGGGGPVYVGEDHF